MDVSECVCVLSEEELYYVHLLCRYKGHVNGDYKLDSCLSHDDAHVISGSEDGRVCFWDLVEVQWSSSVA